MDLDLAGAQAQALSDALQGHFPDQAAAIAERARALQAELQALDRAYAAAAAQLQGRQLIYSHPVYQYFEARYGLPGLSLHWEPDVMPDDNHWAALQGRLEEQPLFVWEAAPDPAIAARLGALGIEQVTVDPGANYSGDWLALQRDNVRALQQLAQTGP